MVNCRDGSAMRRRPAALLCKNTVLLGKRRRSRERRKTTGTSSNLERLSWCTVVSEFKLLEKFAWISIQGRESHENLMKPNDS